MSNEYKDWEQDRKEEAWETINKIVDFLSYDDRDDLDKLEYIYHVLIEGGWI